MPQAYGRVMWKALGELYLTLKKSRRAVDQNRADVVKTRADSA
jgi:hypothetical protein